MLHDTAPGGNKENQFLGSAPGAGGASLGRRRSREESSDDEDNLSLGPRKRA